MLLQLLFLYDIIEDSRVEESIYKYLSNYGRLIDGLNELRDTQYKSIKEFKVDLTENRRFNDLINQIICYIKFGKFKDISDYQSGSTKLQEIVNTYSLIEVKS